MSDEGARVARETAGRGRGDSMNLFISRVLRYGVLLSAAVIGSGLLLFLVTGRSGYGSAGTASPLGELVQLAAKGVYPTGIGEVLRGVASLQPFAIIQLGLLFLIATPITRVAASVVGFAAEKDRLYVLITVYVLAVLLVSFVLGRG